MADLRALETIDWSRHHHAYGPATDVPELLRALVDPGGASESLKAAARKKKQSVAGHAQSVLWGNVFHQGSRWGVSARVVPFIAELARDEALSGDVRRFAVDYLHHLARGYPQSDFPTPFPFEACLAAARDVEALGLPRSVIDGDAFGDLPDGVDSVDAGRAFIVWERDCFLAVERQVPQLVALLESPDDELVGLALALFASFPRVLPETRDPLWRFVGEEAGTPLGGMALVALGALGEPGVREAARVMSDAVDEAHLGSLWASIADVLFGRGCDVSLSSVQRVLHPPPGLGAAVDPFTGDLENLIGRAILLLPESAAPTVLLRLSQKLQRERGFGKLEPLGQLLSFGRFEPGAPRSDRQREIITLIADHGDWQPKMVNANQSQLLRSFGLPDTLEGLRKLA
jgi:hypothetical protein